MWSGDEDASMPRVGDCDAVSLFWRMRVVRRRANVGADAVDVFGSKGCSSSSGSDWESSESDGRSKRFSTFCDCSGAEVEFSACFSGAELDDWGSRGVSAGRLEREREVLRARAGEASRATRFELLGWADGVARELGGCPPFGRNFPSLSRGC